MRSRQVAITNCIFTYTSRQQHEKEISGFQKKKEISYEEQHAYKNAEIGERHDLEKRFTNNLGALLSFLSTMTFFISSTAYDVQK